MAPIEAVRERIVATYRDRTKRSRELFEQAGQALAGGTTRTSVFFAPYPTYVAEGRGARLTDVDGNVLLDFVNNFTSLIHGHAWPPIVDAVERQVRRGSAYAAPTELEVRLARLIQERLPSIERLRFSSSGSEAVMFALRLARAFTGRRKVAKFEGGFHGSHELAQVSVSPALDAAGPAQAPRSVPTSAGIPAEWADDVVVMPYNDAGAVERILDRHAGQVAALIVEPVLGGGVVAATPEFARALRELTARRGILLIFDEIISLRVALGGAQARYGVRPDLTTLGKIIAGGFPMAAFGGRADVMALLDPREGAPAIPQSGTFNGAAVCCAAGLAGFGGITPEVQARIDGLGDDLRARATALFRKRGIPAQAIGVGSLFNLHFSDEPLTDYRAVARGDRPRAALLALALLNRGVFLASRGMGCISSVMTTAEVDAFLAALEAALVEDLEY